MQQQARNNLSRLLRSLLLWTLILPAASAEETATESADLLRPGPDQKIVDIVPVEYTPPISVNINSPIANIHHHGHGHAHEHEHVDPEEEYDRSLVPRSASLSSITFPTSFDTSLSNNFTSDSCPDFFNNFLSDSTFTDCHAISTLLRDSTSFFHILSSAASTSLVLDIACSADVTSCADTMSSFASDLLDDSNCGQDYEESNPLVTDAYFNMITYEPIYRATCLQNPDTSDYCFVDAVTNTSNPTDYDVYLLPYGSTIDAAPYPTCDACLQATLDIFSQWAEVDGQSLADSYLPTAVAINQRCGSGFANVNITAGQGDESPSSASARSTLPLPLWASLSISISMGMLFGL
ncbi:hypothetical protein BDW59DRAFT_154760 [Aspergillus cavernicola]|uniref:DUF7729 domain-containing protein n=1 Tax=Aspergillus cavernicola TaxID=176166 RepID=A0ABR4HDR1_9EURO